VTRADGRAADELRPVLWELGFQEWAAGSVLFSMGKTRVLVAASVDDDAPRWLKGTGAVIMRGVTIGDGSIVGAGSIVTRDVPPATLVAGNPARVIRSLDD
jgi:carbonic anhydrase/acetyltransferase-like protein (isoleucine patch superfamily)